MSERFVFIISAFKYLFMRHEIRIIIINLNNCHVKCPIFFSMFLKVIFNESKQIYCSLNTAARSLCIQQLWSVVFILYCRCVLLKYEPPTLFCIPMMLMYLILIWIIRTEQFCLSTIIMMSALQLENLFYPAVVSLIAALQLGKLHYCLWHIIFLSL